MNKMSSFSKEWEANIYSKGKQLNLYPFSDVVSYVKRLYSQELKSGKKLKALELGFGAGNNILFLAKEGFETFGIEGSKSACIFAQDQLKLNGLNAQLEVGDFVQLPYKDNFFDFVLDREAIYCNKPQDIRKIIKEVCRVLKKGGRFLSFMYSQEHGSLVYDKKKLDDENTFSDFKRGCFEGTGIVHFFSKDEIESYLDGFEIEFINHAKRDGILPKEYNEYAEYHTCARKI